MHCKYIHRKLCGDQRLESRQLYLNQRGSAPRGPLLVFRSLKVEVLPVNVENVLLVLALECGATCTLNKISPKVAWNSILLINFSY